RVVASGDARSAPVARDLLGEALELVERAAPDLEHDELRLVALGHLGRPPDGVVGGLRAVGGDEDPLNGGTHSRSRKPRTAPWASSLSIESASQSRAWLIVSCQDRSRQKLSCCFA